MKQIHSREFIDDLTRDLHALSFQATVLPKKRLAGSMEGVGYKFNVIEADQLINSVAERLCALNNMKMLHCKINEYGCSDYCGEHADTVYKDCYTLILNLLPSEDSLKINGQVVPEKLYDLTIIEPNELHEVQAGHNRMSLVIFARSVNQVV